MSSIVKTLIIVVVVWGVALLQLQPVIASEAFVKAEKVEKKKDKPVAEHRDLITLERIEIVGVQKKTSLNNLDVLWQQFENKSLLQNRLVKQPDRVVVLYQNFDNNYQQADIAIGYPKNLVSPATDVITIAGGKYAQVLPNAKYSDAELMSAWQKLDYRKSIHSVVETHDLNSLGEVTSSQVSVLYK